MTPAQEGWDEEVDIEIDGEYENGGGDLLEIVGTAMPINQQVPEEIDEPLNDEDLELIEEVKSDEDDE